MDYIKVLWIDDEYEKFNDFIDIAKVEHDILIQPYPSYTTGIQDFNKNHDKYDAVILDAKFKEKDSSNEANEDRYAFKIQKQIKEISPDMLILMYTGNLSGGLEEVFGKENCYDKSKKYSNENILKHIRNWYKSKDEIKIKKEYSKTFEIFNEKYIGGEYENDLVSMIKDKNNIDQVKIRKIIEAVHTLYIKKRLLPFESKKLFSANVINRFICGLDATKTDNKEVTYELKGEFKPPKFFNEISRAIWRLCLTPLHHQENSEVKGFYKENLNFQYGMVMMLCDYLVYVKHYVDKHPDGAKWNIEKK